MHTASARKAVSAAMSTVCLLRAEESETQPAPYFRPRFGAPRVGRHHVRSPPESSLHRRAVRLTQPRSDLQQLDGLRQDVSASLVEDLLVVRPQVDVTHAQSTCCALGELHHASADAAAPQAGMDHD